MNRKLILTLIAAAIASLALVACGSDDSSDTTTEAATTTEATTDETTTDDASGGKGGTIEIAADPNGDLSYTTGDLTVDSGTVTIEFENASSTPHDVRIEDSSGNDVGGTEVITDSSETVEVDLEPGDYTYYCSVPGHREAGMEGKLTVE